MKHLENSSHDTIKMTPSKLDFFRNFSTLLSIMICGIVVSFYNYQLIPTPDGSENYIANIGQWPLKIMSYLGYGQLITSFTLLIGTYRNKSNIIIQTGWRQKIKENKVAFANDVKFVLERLLPEFGDVNISDLPLQSARTLLLTEGPYINAFKNYDEKGNQQLYFHYKALDFEYKWISLSFLMQNGSFVFAIIYLAFSIQGSF